MTKIYKPKFLILGGGVTGFTAGWKLSQTYKDQVLILEKGENIGGLASTQKIGSFRCDLGSHRIHTNYDPDAFKLIKELIGNDLLTRPRRGRILIQKKFLSYPASFFSMLRQVKISQLFRFAIDFFWAKANFLSTKDTSSFDSYLKAHLGKSLYEVFYAPYALKLWGLPPNQISQDPAKNRVTKFNLFTIAKEVFQFFSKTKGPRNFYYPRKGIGQITEKLSENFLRNGGQILLSSNMKRWELDKSGKLVRIEIESKNKETIIIEPEAVISTIPLKINHKFLNPDPQNFPPYLLKSRSLRILYLVINGTIKSEHETFYIPDTDYMVGRVSDIRKYSPDLSNDVSSSVLAIEIPFSPGDSVSSMDDLQISKQVAKELIDLKIIDESHTIKTSYFSKIIPDLYPIFDLKWKHNLKTILDGINKVPNLYLIGRSALFLHCNIDHCMKMALTLADFLKSNQTKNDWLKNIETFLEFRVKD